MCACVRNFFLKGTVDHVGKARHGYRLIASVFHRKGSFHLLSANHVENFLLSPDPRKNSSTFNRVYEA